MKNNYDDIRPYGPGEVKPAVESLLRDRQFMTILRGFIPLPKSVIRFIIRTMFIGVNTPLDFQLRYMKHVVRYVLRKCSDGCTFGGHPLPSKEQHHTYLSNHRDIVLDSAILDLKLVEEGYDNTVEIAIGDNLLISPWIRTLVKINKAFTVKRGLSPRQLLESSMLMSNYIHHAVKEKGENIWIAQREGRAKDSDDRTQESVLKMLGYGGNIRELNIVPLTISYEFDPCDYLKAREMQLKRDNPKWKKSRKDDLVSMSVGIKGQKGRIVYRLTPSINHDIDAALAERPELRELSRNEQIQFVCELIDRHIHAAYEIYPRGTEFDEYIESRLQLIHLSNKDTHFLRDRLYEMCNYPVLNY